MSHEDGAEGPIPGAPGEGGTGQESPTRTEGEGATLDLPEGLKTFAPGQTFGWRAGNRKRGPAFRLAFLRHRLSSGSRVSV